MEFNEKTRQTVLIRARHILTGNLFMYLFLLLFHSPGLFLPKPHWSPLFSTFGSSPKHPIVSLVRSWKSLPLHPVMWPTSLDPERGEGRGGTGERKRERSRGRNSHWLILTGFTSEVLLGSPGSSRAWILFWFSHLSLFLCVKTSFLNFNTHFRGHTFRKTY